METSEIVGLIMIVTGIAFGLYVGVWVCFIGGIVDVISEIKAEHLSALGIAVGIAKLLFAGVAGRLSALFLIVPGAAALK